jgi:hypothetical protein
MEKNEMRRRLSAYDLSASASTESMLISYRDGYLKHSLNF